MSLIKSEAPPRVTNFLPVTHTEPVVAEGAGKAIKMKNQVWFCGSHYKFIWLDLLVAGGAVARTPEHSGEMIKKKTMN